MECSRTVFNKIFKNVIPSEPTLLFKNFPYRESSVGAQRHIRDVYTVALFVVAKDGKQPKCPSVGQISYGMAVQWNVPSDREE